MQKAIFKHALEVVADKGYENAEDMVRCLEEGVIQRVIMNDGKDEHESRRNPPQSEENREEAEKPESIYGTHEKMSERAKEGYFVRDPERNPVYCPAGEILRQKCIKKNGNTRYTNKNACKHCKNRNKCHKGKGEWKEIDFTKDNLEKPCKEWLEAEGQKCANRKQTVKGRFEKIKVVKFFLKPNREKMSKRMCLSEHPFGTIKRAMEATYFLLKGLRKVTGEFALFCLGYNIERAKSLLGFNKMMELMARA